MPHRCRVGSGSDDEMPATRERVGAFGCYGGRARVESSVRQVRSAPRTRGVSPANGSPGRARMAEHAAGGKSEFPCNPAARYAEGAGCATAVAVRSLRDPVAYWPTRGARTTRRVAQCPTERSPETRPSAARSSRSSRRRVSSSAASRAISLWSDRTSDSSSSSENGGREVGMTVLGTRLHEPNACDRRSVAQSRGDQRADRRREHRRRGRPHGQRGCGTAARPSRAPSSAATKRLRKIVAELCAHSRACDGSASLRIACGGCECRRGQGHGLGAMR